MNYDPNYCTVTLYESYLVYDIQVVLGVGAEIDFDTEIDFFKPNIIRILDMTVPNEPLINCQDYDLN